MTQSLTYQLDHRFPIAVVRLTGRLTPVTSPAARTALLESFADEPTCIVVDLSGLLAAEDVSLALLPAAARLAGAWLDAPILLCAARPGVAGALHRTGVADRLPVHASRHAALATAARAAVAPRVRRRLEPTVHAPGTARELVARACRDWDLPDAVTPATLVSSELVSNAVRHAGTVIEVTVSLRRHHLRVSVRDGTHQMARLQTPGGSDGHGRGLRVVDAVAAAWGSVPLPRGKTVWASLPLPRSGAGG